MIHQALLCGKIKYWYPFVTANDIFSQLREKNRMLGGSVETIENKR